MFEIKKGNRVKGFGIPIRLFDTNRRLDRKKRT